MTASFVLFQDLEVADRYHTTRVGYWVVCFVPVGIVFSTNHMEEVASSKGKFMRTLSLVIVKGLDDFFGCGDSGRFLGGG